MIKKSSILIINKISNHLVAQNSDRNERIVHPFHNINNLFRGQKFENNNPHVALFPDDLFKHLGYNRIRLKMKIIKYNSHFIYTTKVLLTNQ